MRFTIVGAGALGTIVGSHLIAAGHDVTMVVRGARARQVAAHGLVVRGLRELTESCTVVEPGTQIDDPGVLMFCVKTHHMQGALDSLAGLRPAAVLSLANGVMKNEQLVTTYGSARVLGCMANVSGELHADGAVSFTRNVRLPLGALPGYRGPSPGAIAAAIDAAGVVAQSVDDIETIEWSKFAGWLAMFCLSLLARTTTGVFLDNPQLARVGVRLVREAAAIAAARGLALVDQSPIPVPSVCAGSEDDGVQRLREVGREFSTHAPTHRMSSLQDLEAGRALEVHETLGYAVQQATRLGVAAPTLALCYPLIAGLDSLARR